MFVHMFAILGEGKLQGNLYDLNILSAIFQYFHVSNQLDMGQLANQRYNCISLFILL